MIEFRDCQDVRHGEMERIKSDPDRLREGERRRNRKKKEICQEEMKREVAMGRRRQWIWMLCFSLVLCFMRPINLGP